MGDAGIERRIARLVTRPPGGVAHGTGFLVGPRHLLTAFHVVGARRPVPALFAGDVEVIFDDVTGKAVHTTRARVVPGAHDGEADWALLELVAGEPTIPGASPWPLRRAPRRPRDPWSSYGFTGGPGAPGQAYTGTVDAVTPELQLFCGGAYQGAKVRGLSGAPCVIDEHAVGVIICASDPIGTGYAVDGAMFVRPIDEIAAACPAVAALMPAAEPPFVPQVVAELAGAGVQALLPAAGKIAQLPSADRIAPERLPPLVAERLLGDGVPRAVDVLEPLSPQLEQARAERILDLTASVWLADDATAVLARAILANRRRVVIGLNAATPELGARFVHRAGYPTAQHPGWQTRLRTLDQAPGERRIDDFYQQARARFCELLGCDDAELIDEHAVHDHLRRPLILVVPPPLPPAAAVTRVHDDFDRVRLVLLCGADGQAALVARFPDAIVVEPPLGPDDEARARKQYTRALRQLTDCYAALRPKVQP